MISLCAVFEDWYIFDGGYPPLKKGQKVNLSFKMFYRDYEITGEGLYVFEQIKNGEYNFAGKMPDSRIHDIFRSAKFSTIGMALAHSNQKIAGRFLDCSNLFYKEGILKLYLEDIKNIVPKSLSDKQKARIFNGSDGKEEWE